MSERPKFDPLQHPHRRHNPLLDEWVLVSPHRTQRPWEGQREEASEGFPAYDARCYLCPGNVRANGATNPDYEPTFAFVNDFSALLPTTPDAADGQGLLRTASARGECRVICFSPRHDLTLAKMTVEDVAAVVELWVAQTTELSQRYAWVQVFENRGATMGASNPHPHGQIWASEHVPTLPAREDRCQRAYLLAFGRTLLGDYLGQELSARDRLVVETDHWVWLVPFWAMWPYEVLLLPKRDVASLTDLRPDERRDLAFMLGDGLRRYDALFDTSFPYSMGWHGAPGGADESGHWRLHAHFYPPLLRSATVRKFMVGYEMFAEPQRDITPEQAAARLREL